MTALAFRPGTVVLPEADALTVVTSGGTYVLRARGLDRLHARLSEYLIRGISLDTLLESVAPAHHASVRAYVERLVSIGAVASRSTFASGSLGDTEAHVRALVADQTLSVTLCGRRVTIAINATAAEAAIADEARADIYVVFGSTVVIASLARRAHWPPTRSFRAVYVDCDALPEPPAAAVMRRRARLSLQLVRAELVHGDLDEPRVRGCRDQSATGELVGRALMESDASAAAFQISVGAVRDADVDQMPLAVVCAEPADGTVPRILAGVSAVATRWAAAASLVTRDPLCDEERYELQWPPLSSGAAWPELHATSRAVHDGFDHRTAPLTGPEPARTITAGSWRELRLRIVEIMAYRATAPRAQTRRAIDLLAQLPTIANAGEAAFLQHVLAIQYSEVPGWCTPLDNGLWVVEARSHRAFAFDASRAYAAVAMRLVWDAYYGRDGAEPARLVLSTASSDEMSRNESVSLSAGALAGAAGAVPPRPSVHVRCVRGLGTTVWEATLFGSEPEHRGWNSGRDAGVVA